VRDFDRAIHLFIGDYFPLVGPEANNGGMIAGTFFYILLSCPLFLHYSYESIINFIINIICVPLIFLSVKKIFWFIKWDYCFQFISS
jgi:hypothetical protein